MEKKKRQSGKQKHAIERVQKIKALRLEFREHIDKLTERFEIDEKGLRQLEVANLLGLDEEEFVSRELEKWENESFIPSGLYQEPDEPKLLHQQKFVEAIKNASPYILEELRPLTENFIDLFGVIASDDEFLQKLNIIFSLNKSPYQALDNFPFTRTTSTIYQRFSWKRYKVPLLWTKYIFDREKSNNKDSVPIPNDVQVWLDELYEPKDIWMEKALESAKTIKEEILNILQESTLNKDLIWENFLNLQCGLYEWMERNHLERDFLLENAYIYLFQFSQNENLPIKDLKLWGRTIPRRLQSYDLEFKSDGWWANNERPEEYKKRVIQEFNVFIKTYIYDSSNFLQLYNKSHITKPKDPNFQSLYWLIAWNEGATYSQIGRCFNQPSDTVKSGINNLKEFDLPKRMDKPGRKGKNLIVSKVRIQEIRKVFIDSKSANKNKKRVRNLA